MTKTIKKRTEAQEFIQAWLDADKRPQEQQVIDTFRKMVKVVNPDSSDGQVYNQRQVLVKIVLEWLAIDKPKPQSAVEGMLQSLQDMIIESHTILYNTLQSMDLRGYTDSNGNSAHDKLEDALKLSGEALRNVTADKIVHVELDDEDEPGDW